MDNNLVLAVFSDEFFESAATLVKTISNRTYGIEYLRKSMLDMGYQTPFINATIKRLIKKGLI